MSRSKLNPHWSGRELVNLKNMREIKKFEWPQIAAHLPGRSAHACRDAYFSHVTRKKVRDRRPGGEHSLVHQRPEDSLLEARERRRAANELRDTTAVVFGDPPPGYSALDEKLGARS